MKMKNEYFIGDNDSEIEKLNRKLETGIHIFTGFLFGLVLAGKKRKRKRKRKPTPLLREDS
jgi:hypothetical protein